MNANDVETLIFNLTHDDDVQTMMDASLNSTLFTSVLNSTVDRTTDHAFSHAIQPKIIAADQSRSGRCWAFAGLNLLRRRLIQSSVASDSFELSQTHFMFYDKLEKARYFLYNIERTKKRKDGSRMVMHILKQPIEDGGDWSMFVNIVTKYGVVPASVMTEAPNAKNSSFMNQMLQTLLRQFAHTIRTEDNYDIEKMMRCVARVLIIALGAPPSDFEWTYDLRDASDPSSSDEKKKVDSKSPLRAKTDRIAADAVRCELMTPHQLFDRCNRVGPPLQEYVCLVNLPSPDKTMWMPYSVVPLGNMVGAPENRYINVPIDVLARAAYGSIRMSDPVWFSCEFGEMRHLASGTMHHKLLRYDRAFGCRYERDKEKRILSQAVDINHAMLLTGFHAPENRTVERWQVENSYGSDIGVDGYFSMSDGWFQQYVYACAVHPSHMPPEHRLQVERVSKKDVITVPPWDVLGIVANARGSE